MDLLNSYFIQVQPSVGLLSIIIVFELLFRTLLIPRGQLVVKHSELLKEIVALRRNAASLYSPSTFAQYSKVIRVIDVKSSTLKSLSSSLETNRKWWKTARVLVRIFLSVILVFICHDQAVHALPTHWLGPFASMLQWPSVHSYQWIRGGHALGTAGIGGASWILLCWALVSRF